MKQAWILGKMFYLLDKLKPKTKNQNIFCWSFLFSGYHIREQLLHFWMLRVELLLAKIIKVNSFLGKNSCETSSYDKPFPKYRKFFPSGNFLHWIIFIPKYKFFLGTNSFIGETGLFFPNFKVFLLLNSKI